MKSILLPLLFITVLISCKQNTAPEIEEPNANHIVNEAIKVTGGDAITSSTLQFKFRDKRYKAVRDGGAFTLNRSFTDSIGEVRDVLSNSGFARFVNNEEIKVVDSIAKIYSNAVNSVHYFSIRSGKASITESFCEFNDRGELFVVNMTIQEYLYGNYYNHAPKAERKLLLNKKELKKLNKEVQNTGLTIIPLRMFINDKGFAKLTISLAKGKKLYDKREAIKDRDSKRQLDRIKKNF